MQQTPWMVLIWWAWLSLDCLTELKCAMMRLSWPFFGSQVAGLLCSALLEGCGVLEQSPSQPNLFIEWLSGIIIHMSPSACVSDAWIDSLLMLSNDDNIENDLTSTNIWTHHRACLPGHKNALNRSDQITETLTRVWQCGSDGALWGNQEAKNPFSCFGCY